MPGHKGGAEFARHFPIAAIDITELSYSDNLACPQGVIAAAQRDIAEIAGANFCHILTDGSTSGVLSMLYAAGTRGKKIIVPRNCHKSIWNGCRLLGLEPIIAACGFSDGLCTPPEPEEIQRLLDVNPDICGMIAVSPDYYGKVAPLDEYARILRAKGKLLLVDGAHGAHLAFNENRRHYAGVYADLWVDGAHKTLPTLTQGAAVFCKDAELDNALSAGLDIFRTTSPSYPVMASVEYGYKYLYENKRLLRELRENRARAAARLSLEAAPADDETKLAVDFGGAGICADKAAEELEKRGIYPELSDGRYVLFYLSPTVDAAAWDRLVIAVDDVVKSGALAGTYAANKAAFCNKNTGFLRAVNAEKERVPIEFAVGRICAENAGIMPPCIPLAVAGDIITEECAAALSGARGAFGTDEGKVTVVKGER